MTATVRTAGLILLGLLALLLFASTFIVQQTQYALVLRLGAVRATLNEQWGKKPLCYVHVLMV